MNYHGKDSQGRTVITTQRLIALTLGTICIVAFTISYGITAKIQGNKNIVKGNDVGNKIIDPSKTDRFTVIEQTTAPQQTETSIPTSNIAGVNATPAPQKAASSIPTSNIAGAEATTAPEVIINRTGYVNHSVFTHPTPETNSANVYTLNEGQTVTIVADVGGWYKLSDGTYVWNTFIAFP